MPDCRVRRTDFTFIGVQFTYLSSQYLTMCNLNHYFDQLQSLLVIACPEQRSSQSLLLYYPFVRYAPELPVETLAVLPNRF